MRLGNVNICHTIIINCDHPRIEEITKIKKNMNKKRRFIVALMQMLSYIYSCILRIKTERLFC